MKYKFTLALTAIFGLCITSAFAVPHFWVDTTGDWFHAPNWTPVSVPTAGDNATIGDTGATHALTGTANINAGAAHARNLFLGSDPGTSGTVNVNNTATLTVVNDIDVGVNGTGRLNINVTGGAGVKTNNIFIGTNAGSNGRVVVTGPDLNYGLTSNLFTIVGDAGTGRMDVLNGGGVNSLGNAVIGATSTGVGTVNVDGVNVIPSEWTIGGNLVVGENGKGTLNITNGGQVDPFDAFIAEFLGSKGTVVVDGAGSTFKIAHDLFVGGNAGAPGGNGELDITNGGAVNVGNNMTVWGKGSDGPAVLAIDHTYNLTVGGTLFYQGGILRFLDNQVDFGPPPGGGFVSGNPVFLGTATGPVGMIVDTNGFFNIVGPGQTGFPRISELLTGPGGLDVRGGGDVFLTNNNTFTGLTHVMANSFLFIDGSVRGSALVDAGSFLGGKFDGVAANVGGNLTVNGTFSPGDIILHGLANGGVTDPQLFAVFGNATFNPGSTYVAEVGNVDIGPFPQPGSDLLVTLGSTKINGGTIIVPRRNGFEPLPTEFLGGPPNGLAGEASETTVILAVGGRTGQFGTLVAGPAENWPGLIQPAQDTDEPNVLEIKYVLHPFASVPGLCDNQLAVAEALDTAVTELPIRKITFLGFIPVPDLPQAFELIAPEEYAAMYEMSFSHSITMDNSLQRHMDDIHAGATGYCGPVVEVNPPPIQDKNSVDSKKQVAPAFVPSPENRWSIWVQGNGDFVDVGNKDECAHGYNIDNGSVTAGVDYRIMHNLAIGVYGGYLGSNADLVNRGSINMAQGNVGGYATFSWNGFYLDASGGGGWSNYHTHRFALGAFDQVLGLDFGPIANGQTDGEEVNAMGAIGYDWHFDTGKLGCLNIGPLVSVQYTDVNLDGFTERGSLLPLEFPQQDEDSLRLTVGGRASFDIKANNGIILRPEVRASWLHEFSDQEYPIVARFADAPASPTFTVDGPRIGKDGALIGAGMTIVFSPSFSIFAFYDGVAGRTNYDLNSVTGGFRISF